MEAPGVSIQDGDMWTGVPAQGGSFLAPGAQKLGVCIHQQIYQNILCPSVPVWCSGSQVLEPRKQVYPTYDFWRVGKYSSRVFLVH